MSDIQGSLIEEVRQLIASKDQFTVRESTRKELTSLILDKHYAGRLPSVSYAYALYHSGELVGGVTFGKPASPFLCIGIAGEQFAPYVYELNRLIADRELPKNTLSWFLGAVLKHLRSERVALVSFADDGVGHHGYIYQATNWVYTGKTKERTDKYMPGGKHARHYTEEWSHIRKVRTSKHRYVFVPNKALRREFMASLKYPTMPYPKGDNDRYTLGEKHRDTVIDTRTGERMFDGDKRLTKENK